MEEMLYSQPPWCTIESALNIVLYWGGGVVPHDVGMAQPNTALSSAMMAYLRANDGDQLKTAWANVVQVARSMPDHFHINQKAMLPDLNISWNTVAELSNQFCFNIVKFTACEACTPEVTLPLCSMPVRVSLVEGDGNIIDMWMGTNTHAGHTLSLNSPQEAVTAYFRSYITKQKCQGCDNYMAQTLAILDRPPRFLAVEPGFVGREAGHERQHTATEFGNSIELEYFDRDMKQKRVQYRKCAGVLFKPSWDHVQGLCLQRGVKEGGFIKDGMRSDIQYMDSGADVAAIKGLPGIVIYKRDLE